MATQITKGNITWTFDGDYQDGQYVTGDYYIYLPSGTISITEITPQSIDSAGRIINGSMVNPDPTLGNAGYARSPHGYFYDAGLEAIDGTCKYYESLNAARINNAPASLSNPLVLSAGQSLISTITYESPVDRSLIQEAQVLTIIDTLPAAGSFRPPYCGSDKVSYYNISSLQSFISSLPSLDSSVILSGLPDYATASGWLNGVCLDHLVSYSNQRIHPDWMPDYGASLASRISDMVIWLTLDFSDIEKLTILTNLVQYGIDLYGIMLNGYIWDGAVGHFRNDGGHNAGRKLPIFLAGKVFNDSGMISVTTDPDNYMFQEDQTVFTVDKGSVSNGDYINSMIGMPEWGIRHGTAINLDTAVWNTPYRVTNSQEWFGMQLFIIMMDWCADWGKNEFFDYIDRVYQYSITYLGTTGGIHFRYHRYWWLAYRQLYINWPYKDWSTYNLITYKRFNPAVGIEFLVYNTENWMDRLTTQEVQDRIKENPKFEQRYNARYQKGDIVEIQESPYWTGANAKGFRKDIFRLVIKDGMTRVEAEQYQRPKISDINGQRLDYKREYYFDSNDDIIQKTVSVSVGNGRS